MRFLSFLDEIQSSLIEFILCADREALSFQ